MDPPAVLRRLIAQGFTTQGFLEQRHRWRGVSLSGAISRRLRTAALMAFVLLPLAGLVTYNPWADGPWRQYLGQVAFAVVFAAGTWLLVWVQVRSGGPGRVLPWLAMFGVLLPSAVVHYVRLGHPLTRTRQAVVIETFSQTDGDDPVPARWVVDMQSGAHAAVAGGRLRIVNPPRASGYVGLHLPDRFRRIDGQFWLPLGIYDDLYGETLEWTAEVHRDNTRYLMVEVRNLFFEVTPSGLHATYLGLDGNFDGAEVDAPEISDGQNHRYRLERTGAHPLQRLWLDGHLVWARPKTGHWDFVRFGDARSDANHGGTLLLDDVRYARHYVLDPDQE